MEELGLDLTDNEELYVTGEVLAIFFSNPSNFYKVMLIGVEDTNSDYSDDEITMTGNFGRIQEGASYKFYGEITNHPKYGMQFKVDRYETSQPSSSESLINYLSSSQFKGIGEKTAEKVVDALGENVIDSIVENPAVLNQVPGLSKKQKETLEEVLSNEYGMQKVILQLNRFGIDNALAFRIYGKYEERTSEVIRENPYQLILEIDGIGFNRADMIAEHLEIKADADERIQAAIYYALFTICSDSGDTYVIENHLIEKTIAILERSRSFLIDRELVESNLKEMSEEGRIYEEEGRYFLATIYHSEWGIVRSIEFLLDGDETPISDKQFKRDIKNIEEQLDIEYGDSQKVAIKEAMESSIFILTGGPGTGKTTVLQGIVHLFAELNDLSLDPYAYKDEAFPILMAAPTGRAAKRMKETTGLPASTIHRLLGLTADDEDLMEDSEYQLDGKLLIIDEMSMVDTFLANRLFQSVSQGMKVILVGDQDQLPSVGPGQVFRDLIESGMIPQKELKEIYRQGDGSSIIPLAHEIKHNRLPADLMEKKKDRNFFRANSSTAVPLIETIVSRAMEKGYTAEEIQVLAPMYKGPAGINVLNERLQEIFNPNPDGSRTEMKHIDTTYRIGDKVLQLQNDPENNVFNGDLGFITSITKAKYTEVKSDLITVDFEGNEVEYLRANFNKITLAYCTSIHKAQGSEYDIVILPLLSSYGRMLKKDIMYTAITRASKSLSLIGEPEAFLRSIESQQNLRNTALRERLQSEKHHFTVEKPEKEVVDESVENPTQLESQASVPKSFILTPEMVEMDAVDAMIGMEGLRP
ncbi:MAG TPA: ATP-dependent RecD-like DNA helicase [Atopostipes sp.]|nr:ATP-dependent RecD-like DNA helicase [Atopostipes sp.]